MAWVLRPNFLFILQLSVIPTTAEQPQAPPEDRTLQDIWEWERMPVSCRHSLLNFSFISHQSNQPVSRLLRRGNNEDWGNGARRSSSHSLATPNFSIFTLVPSQDIRLAFEFQDEYLDINIFYRWEFLPVNLWSLTYFLTPSYKLDPCSQFFSNDCD